MLTPTSDTMTVHLKSGQSLRDVILGPSHQNFGPNDLTDNFVHKFISKNKKTAYIVQGSNIAYVEVSQ